MTREDLCGVTCLHLACLWVVKLEVLPMRFTLNVDKQPSKSLPTAPASSSIIYAQGRSRKRSVLKILCSYRCRSFLVLLPLKRYLQSSRWWMITAPELVSDCKRRRDAGELPLDKSITAVLRYYHLSLEYPEIAQHHGNFASFTLSARKYDLLERDQINWAVSRSSVSIIHIPKLRIPAEIFIFPRGTIHLYTQNTATNANTNKTQSVLN